MSLRNTTWSWSVGWLLLTCVLAPPNGSVASDHWAFQPPVRPRPSTNNEFGAANAIDTFVRSKLGEMGLEASPEANRATLIRRLSLDLLGLPPAPEDVSQFLSDESPDASVAWPIVSSPLRTLESVGDATGLM